MELTYHDIRSIELHTCNMHVIRPYISQQHIYWGVGFSGRGIHIVLLLQKSATSPGWTPGTSYHYLPNSHLWLREVACVQQRPYPGTPCWLTHHITVCCLHKLMNTAYSDYSTKPAVSSDEVYSFEAWCDSRKQQSPQFQSWYLVLSMELEILSLSLSSDCSGKLTSTYTASHWLD